MGGRRLDDWDLPPAEVEVEVPRVSDNMWVAVILMTLFQLALAGLVIAAVVIF